MPDLRKARTRLQIAVGTLLILDVAAVVLLLTPYAGSEASRQQQMRQLWLDLKSRENAPWRGLDKKIPQAKQEVADFYRDRFPPGYSEISNSVDKIASESGVRFPAKNTTRRKPNWKVCSGWKFKLTSPAITCNWCASSILWSAANCFSSSGTCSSAGNKTDRSSCRLNSKLI